MNEEPGWRSASIARLNWLVVVVDAADHGAHRAVEVGEHGRRLLRMIIAAELADLVLDRVLRVALDAGIERGPHHEGAVGDRAREGLDELLHLVEGPVEVVARRSLVAAVDGAGRIAAGAEHLALGHEPGLDQVVEHDVGAAARRRQVDVRRELGRRLEQPGEHRPFGEVHLAGRLAEVEVRRGVDAEGAAAHVGAVEIELENLVLGEPALEPQGEEGLLHLALDGALVAQEQVLGELLGDRGAALDDAAGLRIGEHGAEGAGNVDAEMLVEAPVLGGEHRLDQMIGQLVERDRMAVLDAAAADLVAVAVEEGHRELGLLQPVLVGGLAERRAGERQHQHEAAEAHGGHFRQRLDDEPAPPSRDMEAVHDVAVTLERLARQPEAAEQPEVEAGVEIEEMSS